MPALSRKPPKDQKPRPDLPAGDNPWAPPHLPGPSPRPMTQAHTPPPKLQGAPETGTGDIANKEKTVG